MSDWKDRAAALGLDAALPLLLTGAVFAVAAAFKAGLLDALGNNPSFSFTLTGSFAIYLATRPSRSETAATIALALLLRIAFDATVGFRSYFGSLWISSAGFLGLASLMVLAATGIRDRNPIQFARAAFFPFTAILVGFLVPTTYRLSPATYDTHLLAVDGVLGFQPSFLLGRIVSRRPLLWNLTAVVYYALPFAVALLCAVDRAERASLRLLLTFGVMSFVGFLVLSVCPATGPIYAFRESFPFGPDASSGVPLAPLRVPDAPRNAMPSLHMAAALLIFWSSTGLRKAARFAAALFLLGTAFATLALGEHYLIDLVVAVPFTLIFYAAFSRSRGNEPWRWWAILCGAALVAGWLALLRFWVQPLLVWPGALGLLALSTIGLPVLMLRHSSRNAKDPRFGT